MKWWFLFFALWLLGMYGIYQNTLDNYYDTRLAVLEQQLNTIQLQLSKDTDWMDRPIKHIAPKFRK